MLGIIILSIYYVRYILDIYYIRYSIRYNRYVRCNHHSSVQTRIFTFYIKITF